MSFPTFPTWPDESREPAVVVEQKAALHQLAVLTAAAGCHQLAAIQGSGMELQLLPPRSELLHRILILLPVADRPRQLADCLDSLRRLCEHHPYGDRIDGRWNKVAVLIADDSADPAALAEHRRLAAEFDSQGIDTEYFGPAEQLALLERRGLTSKMPRLLGDAPPHAFHHKGQGVMRNLIALRLMELCALPHGPLLFWAIDSDQEFRVKVATPEGERDTYDLPYLQRINRLFRDTDALIATGKVVGDPPVSPAVMASNFLDDLIAFLDEMAAAGPEAPCPFHTAPAATGDGAIYHDMADRFGFRPQAAYPYRCPIRGPHPSFEALHRLAGQLRAFFYGEHPTRKTFYDPAAAPVAPGRTIYTGNYMFRPEALRWFLPFAGLRLRMSGPTMGRMLRAELKERFVAANLPMLHKRTQGESGVSEFRPGIADASDRIDLGGEFERQFWGDVMLFAVQRLADQGFPIAQPSRTEIETAIAATQADLLESYNQRGVAIRAKLAALNQRIDAGDGWWNQDPRHRDAVRQFQAFAADMAHNFGEHAVGFARINDTERRTHHSAEIAAAIIAYPEDRADWERLLGGASA